ncbi:MAG: TonB-dependent receptor [Opitutae bacterium]|nr:TonB-dependent receptor [Opitutae bacterium]
MPIRHPLFARLRVLLATGCLALALVDGLWGATSAIRNFRIPADLAAHSLKLFSNQSGIEVLIPAELGGVVRTREVYGALRPREALERMLEGTNLEIVSEPLSGALAVRPKTPPPAGNAPTLPSASPTPRPTESVKAPGRSAHGVIVGQISNQVSGEYLVGAWVQVVGTPFGAASDRDGAFSLSLPPGNYILDISYTGLRSVRLPVAVTPDAVVVQTVALTSEIYQLEAFVVTGLREGSAKAIQNQRRSINAKSVAAIDTFGNPTASVGEILQRLPGVAVDIGSGGEPGGLYVRGLSQASFGSMMVDGNPLPVTDGQTVAGQYTYLGQVSTNNIESAEIIKASLPEMDGNAISGYINLRTKRAFDRIPSQQLLLSAGTKWALLHQDASVPGKDLPKLDLLTLEYSDVFSVLGGKNNLGLSSSIHFNTSATYAYEAGPNLATGTVNASFFTPAPVAGAAPSPLVRGWSSGNWGNSAANNYAKTYGFNLDYKLPAGGNLYLRGTYNDTRADSGFTPSYFRWRVYTGGQTSASFEPQSTYDVVAIPVSQGIVDLESTLYRRESSSLSLAAGGDFPCFARTAKLSLDANYSRNRTTYPAINEVRARITGVGFRIDQRGQDPWYPAITQTDGPDWRNPANYSIVPSHALGSRIIDFNVPSTNQNLRADFQKELALPLPVSLKAGVKLATYRVTSDRRYRYYTWQGAGGTPATGGITPYVGYRIKTGEGHYGPFPFLQVPTTGLPGDPWANPANFYQTPAQVWQSVIDTINSLAEVKQTIAASYLQGQVRAGPLRVLGGLRIEGTDARGASPSRRIVTTGPEANNAAPTLSAEENAARARANWTEFKHQQNAYTNVFPGAHLVYEWAGGLQARASYNMTIVRPNPSELTPRINYTENPASPGLLTKGNPELKPYTADNFEAALQYYFEPVGMVSVSAFLKEIHNYFRTFDTLIAAGPNNGFDGQFAGYTLRQNRNTGSARVRGIELSYQQQYTFLPGALRGLGAYANLTLLQTHGDFGTTTATSRLPNLTPRTWNAGLTWRWRGLDLRLLANYRGRTFISSSTGTFPDTRGGIPGVNVYDLYQDARLLLDLKTQFTFNRVYSVYFDVYNLTDAWSFARSIDAWGHNLKYQAQGNGINFSAGVKARF